MDLHSTPLALYSNPPVLISQGGFPTQEASNTELFVTFFLFWIRFSTNTWGTDQMQWFKAHVMSPLCHQEPTINFCFEIIGTKTDGQGLSDITIFFGGSLWFFSRKNRITYFKCTWRPHQKIKQNSATVMLEYDWSDGSPHRVTNLQIGTLWSEHYHEIT